MVEAGVDAMELQIPFSEPIADGPVILHANQGSLQAGSTVERCLAFGEEVARRFDIPFLLMSYYNILFRYGVEAFVRRMAEAIGTSPLRSATMSRWSPSATHTIARTMTSWTPSDSGIEQPSEDPIQSTTSTATRTAKRCFRKSAKARR